MKLPQTLFFLFAFIATIHAIALPTSFESLSEASRDLFKRKGGGGGGGRGGGGSSGGSRGGSSSSSSSGSSSGSRGSGSSSSGSRGSSAGSGAPRAYGGGAYYGGGAASPYPAGRASPRGIAPGFIGGAALGGLAFFPGLWLYGVYAYSYPGIYHWRNTTSNQNETGPVECLCQQYNPCGCEGNNNTDYLNSVANNGTLAQRAANGTLYINGTLPNGTTAPGSESAAPSLKQGILESSGFWIVIAGVVYTVNYM